MQFIIADLTRKLGLPEGADEGTILAAIRAPESRVLAELGPMPTAATPSDEARLFDARPLRVIGY